MDGVFADVTLDLRQQNVVGSLPILKHNVIAQQAGQDGKALDGAIAAQNFDGGHNDFVG